MARIGKNHLRNWEYPTDSGIRIREIINRTNGRDCGVSLRVSIPSRIAGRRLYRQFTALEKAEAWAKEQHDGARRDGLRHFQLRPAEVQDAIAAFAVLEGMAMSLSDAARFVRLHKARAPKECTIKQSVEELLAEKEAENLRERSLRDLRNRLTVFVERWGERLVSDIGQLDIEQWLHSLARSGRAGSGISARTRKNYILSVRTFFNWTIDRGYRGMENPAARIPLPIIDWEMPTILTPDEAKKLITAATTEQEGRLLASVALGLFAGVRSSEIMQLDWSAIDLDEGILTVGAGIAKKRRLRVVELQPNCVAWLRAVPGRSGRVAPGKYTVRWADFVKKAGFPEWGKEKSNAMRHSFASYHYALHSDAAKTSALLGHRSNDQVLFDSYRSLARRKDAEAYFGIVPGRA